MKIANLLIGTFILTAAFSVKAQEETEQERECKRMRFLAGEEIKVKNYSSAAMYYLKGETICGGYDAANYNRLIGSLRNAAGSRYFLTQNNVILSSRGSQSVEGLKYDEDFDKKTKQAYIDTLVGVYDRMETAGLYDQANDLIRATYIIQSSKPNRAKADELYARAIHKEGSAVTEAHVSYYYYNMYVMFTEAAADKKPELKKRLISEYFFLSKLITAANMSLKTQENLLSYFNGVVKTCDDILPELKGFMKSLPVELESKKSSVKNFITLLEMKECTKSAEYGMLIDTLNRIDPSVDGKSAQARYLRSLGKYGEAISKYKEAKSMATEDDVKEEIEYKILEIQYHDQNSYRTAYTTAMGINGKYRSAALKLAAQCVSQTANSCGSSTFDRKANYLYAAQLADRAGDGSAAARYRASGPSEGDWFEAGVSSVTLSCWGVTVSK